MFTIRYKYWKRNTPAFEQPVGCDRLQAEKEWNRMMEEPISDDIRELQLVDPSGYAYRHYHGSWETHRFRNITFSS